MDDQPSRSAIKKLTLYQVKTLQSYGLLDPHDGKSKFAGSRQDVFLDKHTGELWIARKNYPAHFEPTYINPRKEGVPGY